MTVQVQVRTHRLVFIDWYGWFWSKASYFLCTRLSFGRLREFSSGFSRFWHCQTGGWLAPWQSAAAQCVPDKGVRLSQHPPPTYSAHIPSRFLLPCFAANGAVWPCLPVTPPPLPQADPSADKTFSGSESEKEQCSPPAARSSFVDCSGVLIGCYIEQK